MKHHLTIRYVIAIPAERLEEASLFRGFTPEIMSVAGIILRLLQLPSHPLQYFMIRGAVIQQRMMGQGHWILPLHVAALTHVGPTDDHPLFCVVSTEKTAHETSVWVASQSRPVLHLSTEKVTGAVQLDMVRARAFRQYTARALDALGPLDPLTQKVRIAMSGKAKPWPARLLRAAARHHGVTLPNESMLEHFRYRFASEKRLLPTGEADYVDAILQSARLVLQQRRGVISRRAVGWFFPPPADVILAVPAMFRHQYIGSASWKGRHDRTTKRLRLVLDAFARQNSYQVDIPGELFTEGELPAELHFVGELNAQEMAVFNAGVSVRASNCFAPVLRLPPRLNRLHGTIERLANSARRTRPGAKDKTHRLAAELSTKLAANLPTELAEFVREHGRHIKIIGDVPLEFLHVDGLPLSIARQTSRIPATPGNLMLNQCLTAHRLVLPRDAFSEILVVHSFGADDPLRSMASTALERFQEIRPFKTKLRRVSIASADDLIRACDEYSGAVLIYDGHGGHDRDDSGALMIGGKPLDIWTLRGRIRVPPIVVLSACDTHPADRSHASTGNGFLNIGAMTVLSTMLPVDARHAGLFLGRLLWRIEEFLPIMLRNAAHPVSWASLIWGLLRMMYISQLKIEMMERKFVDISEEKYRRLGSNSTLAITQGRKTWFSEFLEELREGTGLTSDEVTNFIRQYHQLPEAMKYVQLGNPEQVLVSGDALDELFADGSAASEE